MAKKNRKKSIFGTSRRVEPTPTYSSEEREYAKKFEPNTYLKRIVQLIVLIGVGAFAFQSWSYRKEVRAQAAEEMATIAAAKELELGSETYQIYSKLNKEAEVAYKRKDYFEAVYKYRQATNYDPNNITVHQQLAKSLDRSCDSGNSIHCQQSDVVRFKIKQIKASQSK